MKCRHCGGSIVEDPGCFPHGPEKKCISCGRRVEDPPDPKEKKMEEKKKCKKCLNEFPMTTEFFNKNSGVKDGFENYCKTCRSNYFKDRRAGKRIGRSGPKGKAIPRGGYNKPPGGPKPPPPPGPPPIERATPAEIVIALRKGMAAEIVAMINEKYDL